LIFFTHDRFGGPIILAIAGHKRKESRISESKISATAETSAVASATAETSAAADASAEYFGGCRIPSFVSYSVRVDMPLGKGSRKLESSRHKQEIWRMPRQPPKLRRMPRQPPKFRRLPTVILNTEIPFVSFRELSLANNYWTSNPVVREEYQLVKPPFTK
jgi:hypothetical protein